MKAVFAVATVLCLALPSCDLPEAGDDASVGRIGTRGFYSLARDESGVWWFEDPDGEPMVSIGINHIEPVLVCSELNRDLFAEKYGDDLCTGDNMAQFNNSVAASAWARDARKQVKSWGFNTLGVHNPVRQEEMPYVAKFRPFPIDGWAKYERRYPDPFSKETEEILEERAQLWCDINADDPNILGVSFNDMTLWRAGPLRIHGWVRAMMESDETSPGKLRWIEILKENYAGPAMAAQAYGVSADSWNELAARIEWPVPEFKWKVYEDVLDFLPVIADAWYEKEAAAIGRVTRTI